MKDRQRKVIGVHSPHDKYLLSLLDVSGGGSIHGDIHTDRMIFALDNRILSTRIKAWKEEYDVIIAQRCPLDSLVHANVVNYSLAELQDLNRFEELEMPDIMIHMNADPQIAYNRIKNDPEADKYETLEYIQKQAESTKWGYEETIKGTNKYFLSFQKCHNIYVDTSNLSTDETFEVVLKKLAEEVSFQELFVG